MCVFFVHAPKIRVRLILHIYTYNLSSKLEPGLTFDIKMQAQNTNAKPMCCLCVIDIVKFLVYFHKTA